MKVIAPSGTVRDLIELSLKASSSIVVSEVGSVTEVRDLFPQKA